MAYIGKQPVVGNFVKLDAIVTSATTTFNLLNGGVAYFPQSANNCIVSLNGIIQEPTSSGNVGGYTISGSTIVFTTALTSLDVIDFILVLGDTLSIGTPSDGTVSFAKVTSNLITGATAETSIDGADSVLIYDDSATALRKMTRTNFVAGIGATAGQVIQVVSTQKTSIFTTTNGISGSGFADITGLSATITPASASNKILVLATIMCSDSVPNRVYFRLKRGSTIIGNADTVSSGTPCIASSFQGSGASNTDSVGINYLDSPSSTSSLTYQLTTCSNQSNGSSTVRINGQSNSGNGVADDNTTSTITLLEIKG
jgi:hypothetical protein